MKLQILGVAIFAVALSNCTLPKPHIAMTRTPQELAKISQEGYRVQWAYTGSSKRYHHFVQWRYGAMLGVTTRDSFLKRHKVRRNEMQIPDEFPRTRDMYAWRIFHTTNATDVFAEKADFSMKKWKP